MAEQPPLTTLLHRARTGDREALAELLPAVYVDLSRIALHQLKKERPDHTLQAPALVNEAYLKLFNEKLPEFSSRTHFFRVVSAVMRQILLDYARNHNAEKRGGKAQRVKWDDALQAAHLPDIDPSHLIDLHEALDALAAEDLQLAELVELRYFCGLTAEETAEVLGHSVHTVRHDLRFALAWLRKRTSKSKAGLVR